MVVEVICGDIISKKPLKFPSLAAMKVAGRVKEQNNKPRLLLDIGDSVTYNKKIVLDLQIYLKYFADDKNAEYITNEKVYKEYKDVKPYTGLYKVLEKNNKILKDNLKSEFVSPYDTFNYSLRKRFLFYGKWVATPEFIEKLYTILTGFDFVETPIYFSTLNIHLLDKMKFGAQNPYNFIIGTNDMKVLKQYEGLSYYVDILNGTSIREVSEVALSQPKIKFISKIQDYAQIVKWANGKRKKSLEEYLKR